MTDQEFEAWLDGQEYSDLYSKLAFEEGARAARAKAQDIQSNYNGYHYVLSPHQLTQYVKANTEIIKQKADKMAEALNKVLSETEHPYLEQALKEYRGEK